MARINFDDNVEKQEEFWRLLSMVDGDRDKALGMLVRFFRIAQKRFGHGQAIPEDELKANGLSAMMGSGWAIPVDGGFQVLGADKHFDWYRQRVEAGKNGGLARAKAPRQANGRYAPDGNQTDAKRDHTTASPLAPSPSLAPVQIQKEELSKSLEQCTKTWADTLSFFGAKRPLTPQEREMLARGIQARGAASVELACYGARFEPRTEKFNPADFVALRRVLQLDRNGKSRFEDFLSWGARARAKEAAAAEKRVAEQKSEQESEFVDPMAVRALIGSILGGGTA